MILFHPLTFQIQRMSRIFCCHQSQTEKQSFKQASCFLNFWWVSGFKAKFQSLIQSSILSRHFRHMLVCPDLNGLSSRRKHVQLDSLLPAVWKVIVKPKPWLKFVLRCQHCNTSDFGFCYTFLSKTLTCRVFFTYRVLQLKYNIEEVFLFFLCKLRA